MSAVEAITLIVALAVAADRVFGVLWGWWIKHRAQPIDEVKASASARQAAAVANSSEAGAASASIAAADDAVELLRKELKERENFYRDEVLKLSQALDQEREQTKKALEALGKSEFERQEQMRELRRQIEVIGARLSMFESGINILVDQLVGLRIDPAWVPPSKFETPRMENKKKTGPLDPGIPDRKAA